MRARPLIHAVVVAGVVALVAGCAMGPTREDPFEPKKRVS
jgi:hypothetical protein